MNFNKIERRREDLDNYYNDLCEIFNAFKECGINLTAISPELTDEEVEDCLYREEPEIHDNEIESALLMLIHAKSNLIQAILAVQGGKTTAMILYIMLARISHHLKGEKCGHFYLVPGDKGIEEMTIASYEKVTNFLDKITFSDGINQCSYRDVENNAYEERGMGAYNNGTFNPLVYPMTNKKENIEYIKERMATATKFGVKLIILWDESHYAENKKSVAEQILGEDVYKTARDGGHQIVLISATPYPWIGVDKAQKIPLKLGKDYVGFNFIGGKKIDDDIDVITPDIRPFPGDTPLVPKAAFHSKTFIGLKRKYKEQLVNVNSASQYLQVFASETAKLIKSQVGKSGFICRFICNNEKTKVIINAMESQLEDFIVIPYLESMTYNEMQKQIKNAKKLKKSFVICVSGKARMSNRFPKEVQVFIDFTQKYSTVTAAIQGLPGRASGYCGRRIVFVTKYNYDELMKCISSLGADGFKKKHSRTRASQRLSKRVSFRFNSDDERAKPLFQSLVTALGSYIQKQVNQNKKRPRGMWVSKDVILNIYPDLAENYGYESNFLLQENELPEFTPKELSEKLREKYVNESNSEEEVLKRVQQSYMLHIKEGKIFVAFRATDDGGVIKGNGMRSAREEKLKSTSIRQDLKKMRGQEPHMHINMKTGEPVAIELPISKRYCNIKEVKELPTEKSMASALLSA